MSYTVSKLKKRSINGISYVEIVSIFLALILNRPTKKSQEERYIVNKESVQKYHANITKIMETKIRKLYNDNNFDTNDLDDKLNTLITRDNEIEKQIDEFSRAVKTACETSFKRNRAPKTSQNHKSIPWWT